MGARGPARTPTPILKARGSWRAKTRKDEPVFDVIGECPAMLQGESRDEWFRVMEQLSKNGVVTAGDRASLAAYCESWGDFCDATERLRNCRQEKSRWRLLNAKNQTRDALLKAAQQFGLTPAARSRVTATEKAPAKSDKSRFFAAG